MKYKIIIAALVLCFIVEQGEAQLIRRYGVKGGVSQARQAWNYTGLLAGTKIFDLPRIGLDVGGYVEWFNIPVLSVLTEIHYVQKGAEDEFEVTTIDNPEGTGAVKAYTPRIDYLSIPVLAKIRFDFPAVAIYAIGGPRIDLLIGRNEYATGPVFNNLKSREFGLTAGGGIELALIPVYSLGFEIRYSYSSQYAYSNPNVTVRNESTEFLLTIGF